MIDVRPLAGRELERAGAVLPLHRLADDPSAYLVAWDNEEPVGHVHIAWGGTKLGVPELQDMFVLPDRRGSGIGTALAAASERLVAERGHPRCSLSVSEANGDARRLYERLGYAPAGIGPVRVRGTIEVRGGTIDVDDTLIYLVKAVDFSAARSS